MTQEEIELLFQDLCGRLWYSVKISYLGHEMIVRGVDTESKTVDIIDWGKARFAAVRIEKIKSYLRPLSSMTDEEREEFRLLGGVISYNPNHNTYSISAFSPEAYDWLNKKMFDYRDLIPKGLALEAKEGMYNN